MFCWPRRAISALRIEYEWKGRPNYWPNSFDGPGPDPSVAEPPFPVSGQAKRHGQELTDNDCVQAGDLYRKVMTDSARDHLIENIVGHPGGAQKRIRLRQTALFYKADPEYGTRVAKGLDLDLKEGERLAVMSQDKLVKATSSYLYKPTSERKGEQR